MKIDILEDIRGNEIVFVTEDDGTTLSMLKSTWDELEAQKELGGTL